MQTTAAGAAAATPTVPIPLQLPDLPNLPYRPLDPPRPERFGIGLIACGGITRTHLRAYRAAGYRVVALCDPRLEAAEERRRDFYPEAAVLADHRQLLARTDIDVVDIAAHTAYRPALVRAALLAGKHVLSQKPFVHDLDEGRALAALAEERGLRLAVNHNGRWSPPWSWMRLAVAHGLIGRVRSIALQASWDHGWVADRPDFDRMRHVILEDYAIHAFDLVACVMDGRPWRRVSAGTSRAQGQRARPPLLAWSAIEWDDAHAVLHYDAANRQQRRNTLELHGERGILRCAGDRSDPPEVEWIGEHGSALVPLTGSWNPDGFHGTMAELLSAIDGAREAANSARSALRGLELCFAACAAADLRAPVRPGEVTRLQQPHFEEAHR